MMRSLKTWMWSLALAAPAIAGGSVPAPVEDHGDWIADFDKAVEFAKKEKKDLFVDFTGSDWCGWCIKLHSEVFEHAEFLTAAKADFVLVALDFPRSAEAKAKVPNPKRNDELSKRYSIGGFPTILLMTPDGDVYGQTGYQPGGPEKYVQHVKELREKGRAELTQVLALVREFESGTPEAKAKAADAAIERLEKMGEEVEKTGQPPASAGRLVPLAKSAFTADADNKAGRKLRAVKALLAAGQIDDDVKSAAKALDPRNENGLLEKVVWSECQAVNSEEMLKAAVKAIDELDALGPVKDKQLALRIYASAARWNNEFLSDKAKAKVYAQKAKDLGVAEKPVVDMLDEILNS
jgi:thioredoxin-related protein